MASYALNAVGVSFVAALALVPVAMRLAVAFRILDHPCARKIHVTATPLLGGLAVYVAALAYLATAGAVFAKVVSLLVAMAAATILGILDDRYDIHSRFRLMAHLLIAGLLVAAGYRTQILPFWLDVAVGTLWITGMINSMNCMDCADGIVGGMSALMLLGYGAMLVLFGDLPAAILCFAFAGAAVGFLAYNFPPARIFLGDGGSTTLGLLIGAISLRAAAHAPTHVAAVAAFLPAIIPAGDLLLVHARRYLGGLRSIRELLASTGKDHLPHRLLRIGLSSRGTAVVLYVLTACMVLAAVLSSVWIAGALAVLCAGFMMIGRLEYTYCAIQKAEEASQYTTVPAPAKSVSAQVAYSRSARISSLED
ncbi:MAG: glycosyltransferase family 4 protein [Chthonomonadales bacterium]